MHASLRLYVAVLAATLVVAYVLWRGLRREGMTVPPGTQNVVMPPKATRPGMVAQSPRVVAVGGGMRVAARQAGGKTARRGRYPWIVKILMRYPGEGTFQCTGFLISPTQVITADHCANDGLQPKDISLYVGAHKSDGSDGKYHSVTSISRGGGSVNGKDWAVLTMKYPERKYTPVLVDGWNASVSLKKNMPVWSAGFGQGWKGQRFDTLQVNELRLIGGTKDTLLTANNVNGEFRTPCYGDSGGPLFMRGSDPSQDIVIGIVVGKKSRQKSGVCTPGDGPETYVRIADLMKQISTSVSKNSAKLSAAVQKCSLTGRVLRNGRWSCPSSHNWDAGVSGNKAPSGLAGKQCSTDATCAVQVNALYKAYGSPVNRVRTTLPVS